MTDLNNTSLTNAQPPLAGFMRFFAHELGNPVATIRMSSEMLLGGVPQEMHTQLSQMILDEAIHLEALVEAAVYYASLDTIDRSSVALDALVDQSVARRAGSTTVNVEHRSGSGDVDVDPVQLARLLDETILNALQAGARSVQIATELTPERQLIVTITDDGEGFAPGDGIDRVFDPFYTTREGKLGLGASIARKIAELHGGDARLRRTPGDLTEFTYRIPLNH